MTELELYNAELSAYENRMLSVGEITNKFYKKYPEFNHQNSTVSDEVLRYEYFQKIRKEADIKIDRFFKFCMLESNKGKSTNLLIKEFEFSLILNDR
jgi:hypothetical protein